MSKTPADVYWYKEHEPHPGEIFSGSVKTTVAVVGGGMAGLSCAQHLEKAGVDVILIEKDFCGAGASGKSSGFITPDSEMELSSLLDNYGLEKAKRIWEFVVSGVEDIRENIKRLNIDCDYQEQDSFFVANGSSRLPHVEKEHDARKQLKYPATLYRKNALKKVIGAEGYAGAVRYSDTFGMNAYAYCQAMRKELKASGVTIYEQTPVIKIEDKTVITPGGRISADHIVVCTDRFIPELGALKKEIYHVQTFLGITRSLSEKEVQAIFPGDALMVWDTDLVYNYFRLTGDRRLLVGGGDLLYTYARNEPGTTARASAKLKKYLRKKFPTLDIEFETVWAGMLGVSKDFLPVMGEDKKNKHVGYAGAASGLPWAAALGRYAADRIVSGRNELDEDFSPDRHFMIGRRLQTLLSTPVAYALSHGVAKRLK